MAHASAAPDAPFFDPGGKPLRTREVLARAGGLPVLFVFFKVSCPTCRLAWPYLQRLNELYGGRAVRVAGVCQNDAPAGRKYYGELGASFDLLVDPEPGFAASNAFGVEAVPHLALVSADGKITREFEGWSKEGMEELGRLLAAEKKITPRPVVEAGDPVRDFQPG